ncbi:MAG: iron ABC transporter permease [Treponema sp.]|nr:iron ABC transporter permease [Treponema sp.]
MKLRQLVMGLPVLIVLCLFVLVCIAFLLPLKAAFSPLWTDGTAGFSAILTAHVVQTALFTFKVAFGATVIALAVGIPTAFFTSRRNFFGRKFLLSLSAIPFCIPALIVALGFVSFFGINGVANKLLQWLFRLKTSPLKFLYSFWGIIIAEGFYNFPLVMNTVNDTWERIPPDQSDAARLLGAGEIRIFRTITFYQILPAIISAAIPVFLYCFFSFMIVLLFGAVGCSTLEVEIYQAARVTLNFHEAASLALFETLCAFGIVVLYSMMEQRSAKNRGILFSAEKKNQPRIGQTQKTLFRAHKPAQIQKRPAVHAAVEKLCAFFLFSIILLFFLAPFAGIILAGFFPHSRGYNGTFTFSLFYQLIASHGFQTALLHTIGIASATGFLSAATAFTYSCILRQSDPNGQNLFLRTIPVLPMAVSSIVMGFGITMLISRGTPIALVIAQTTLNWPLAFRQIYPSLNRLPLETDDAARLLSSNSFDIIYHVYLPVSRRTLLSAFGFAFAISCGDTTLPLVLAIPDFDTLSLYTYRLAGSYKFTQSCASGALLGLLCIMVFTIAGKLKSEKGTVNE